MLALASSLTCRCSSSLSQDFVCLFFFFFQAEDGIRDHCVTGVQTCALPIYEMPKSYRWSRRRNIVEGRKPCGVFAGSIALDLPTGWYQRYFFRTIAAKVAYV